MNISEKKLVSIFKSFIEKVFVPQIPKMDPTCQKEWNKFSSMLTPDAFNFGELQLYVNTIPEPPNLNPQGTQEKPRNKSPFYLKNRKESPANNDQGGFNPSKTFGGQRARMMFPLKDMEEPVEKPKYMFGKEISKEKDDKSTSTNGISTQAVVPMLQRLFKIFTDNQSKLQRAGGSGITNFGGGTSIGSTYEIKPSSNYYQMNGRSD